MRPLKGCCGKGANVASEGSEGEMAKQLTREELDRLFQLNDERYSYKEMADIICEEFNRETLDRSTIYRNLKTQVNYKKMAALTKGFCNRGHHSWVVESVVSSNSIRNSNGQVESGYLVNIGTRRTCRDCGRVEETPMPIRENKRVVPRRSRIGRPNPYVGERP